MSVRQLMAVIALSFAFGCATGAPVAERRPAPTDAFAYLQEHVHGWAWQDDAGSYSYADVALSTCTLTITEQMRLPTGRVRTLNYDFPLGSLDKVEWYENMPPAGSLEIRGAGVRERWDGESAPRYMNTVYLEMPPNFGERIANAVRALNHRCIAK